jgi:hypothetical protein
MTEVGETVTLKNMHNIMLAMLSKVVYDMNLNHLARATFFNPKQYPSSGFHWNGYQ